jgi:hypothetical protein
MLGKEAHSIAFPVAKRDIMPEIAPDRKKEQEQKQISLTSIQKKTWLMKEAKRKAVGWP